MTGAGGRGRAALLHGETEFDTSDATLLRAIDESGSVAKASSDLGRSRARALGRLETLEAAFGHLVERERGGSGGGGSRVTAQGFELLDRYDRLAAALQATAQVPETALRGTVTSVDGELADVDTAVGRIRGVHDGAAVGDRIQVRVGADAITINEDGAAPAPDATSARNRLRGTIANIERGETVFTVGVDANETRFRALVTADSASQLRLQKGAHVLLTWKATATRLVSATE